VDSEPQSGGGRFRPPLLELKALTKRFPGATALDSVDFVVAQGEIHALVGENGAGKSTLIKILSGTYAADAGQMEFCGTAYRPKSPLDALQAGIRVVYQEFNLLPYLSVAENLLFDRLPRRRGVLLDYRSLYERSAGLLKQVGLDVDPRTRVERLGVAQRQLLEIGKALSSASRLLILDEPTATLTPREIGRLFKIIRDVRASGVSVIYVSHHLNEIFDLCDAVTVLRNGRHVASLAVAETSPPQIVRLMVGRQLAEALATDRTAARASKGAVALRVQDLLVHGNPHGLSLAVQYGEIVGLAGLVGSGRTELLRAIFGADRPDSGEIYRDGRRVSVDDPGDAVRHGICLLTENRKEEGLILAMPVGTNLTLTDFSRISRAGLLRSEAEKSVTQDFVGKLNMKIASLEQPARDLSGGNQPKLVIAKWLYRDAAVLMLDEPTRGIDVGAKAEVFELMDSLARSGAALLMVSSELPELLQVADRILVMRQGRLSGEAPKGTTQEEIMRLAALAKTEENHS